MAIIKKNQFWDDLELPEDPLANINEELKEAAEAIVVSLTEHAGGLTEGQIRKVCFGTTSLLHNALKALLADNVVVRSGKGVKANPYIYKVNDER